MGFDKLNYSTADKVNGTIQDLIDAKKIDIKDLTKDKLKTLKVEILNSKSYLKLRDKKGKIIGRLNKDGENLKFLGGTTQNNGKTFLEVENAKGIKGYVSADYIKGEIKNTTIEAPVVEKSGEAEVVSPQTTDVSPKTKDSGEIISESELSYNNQYIIKDGRIFLVGVDGKKTEYTYELSPEDKEKIGKYEQLMILNEVLEIWTSKAMNVVNGLLWKDSRQDGKNIEKNIEGINALFQEGFNNLLKGENIESTINNIFAKINESEDEEAIIGPDDMKKIKEVLLEPQLNKDQKLIKIYNLMRYDGLSGNSTIIKEKVANHLISDEKFNDINNILSNPNLYELINNRDINGLIALGISKKIANEIIEANSKIKIKTEKNDKEYKIELDKINKERKENGETEISLEEFKKEINKSSIETLIKHSLLYDKIDQMEDRGTENTYVGIYANMSGLGMQKGNDWHVISDDNIDNAINIGATLAISAISMGVGAIAARGALATASWGARATGLANGINRLGRGAGVARWAGASAVEGAAFYEGSNLTHNLIYGTNGINGAFDNAGNQKEIIKSMAFMGVLHGASAVMGKLGKTIPNLGEKVPSILLKGKTPATILAEAGLITGTSVGLEIAFEGEGKLTIEEYLQALVLVSLMRGVSKSPKKIIVNKTPEGIKLIEYKPYTESKEFPGFFKGIDGEFYIKHKGQFIKKSPNNPELKPNHDTIIMGEQKLGKTKTETSQGKTETWKNNNQNIDNNFMSIATKEISSLKDGQHIKIGEYTIKKIKKEYRVEKGDYKKDFLKSENAADYLKNKISPDSKTQVIFELQTKNINAKLNNLKNKEIIIGDKTYRIKEENGSFIIQEKNGSLGFKDTKIEKLSVNEANIILEKIAGVKGFGIKDIITKTSKEKIISKIPDLKIRKIVSDKLNYVSVVGKNGFNTSKDILMWVLRGNKEGNTTMWNLWSSAKGKMGMGAGVIGNELWDMYHNGQTWDETLTISNGLEMFGNMIFAGQVGWLRSIIYNELISQGFNNASETIENLFGE